MCSFLLEDFHQDILGKAMRGLGVGKNEMAQRLSVEKPEIESILYGDVDEALIKAMAVELQLDGQNLIQSARKEWSPVPVLVRGLEQISSSYGDMIVNAYLVWDEDTRKAWIFDTGTDAQPILAFIEKENLKVDAIFLTHTHGDHIACLDKLLYGIGNHPVYVHELEAIEGCESITEGFEHRCGQLLLKTLHTHGHALGGVTYVIEGLDRPIAFVGDAIFAGSMGGGMVSYKDALQTNREKIMTLPDNTILCPGHGPMTTVLEEKKNNPFFPEFT